MRCGILIIGSLLWDDGTKGQRAAWRAARLDAEARVPVQAPFYYGRKSGSRGDTYTMAFEAGGPSAIGVIVPCAAKASGIDDLLREAEALWQAEDGNAKAGRIHKSWGCVGALFATTADYQIAKEWSAYFGGEKRPDIPIVTPDGILSIPWPTTLDGQPLGDIDVILATATHPEPLRPSAEDVADAWLSQSKGYERYFFENVRHGIRTQHDGDIWRCIESGTPSWLTSEAYEQAVNILRSEAAAQTGQE